MRRIKRALSITKAPKIEECLADIHEHHESEDYAQKNGSLQLQLTGHQPHSNNNKTSDTNGK